MRRTTRVFGMVKGGDTSTVLRSGRRLWPDCDEGASRMTIGDGCGKKLEKKKVNDDDCDRFFGTVYNRKRKRIVDDDEGFRFRRHQRIMIDPSVIVAVVKPCYGDISLFSFFLFAVLRSVMRFGLTFMDLYAFVMSETISAVYASRGIQFFQGSVTANVGICQFFRVTQYLPLFCVDFSAIPLCFKSLHSALFLRYMFRSCFLVYNPVNVCTDVVEEEIDLSSDEEDEIDLLAILMELRSLCNSYKKEASDKKTINIVPEVIVISDDDDDDNGGLSSHESVKCSKLIAQNVQSENVNSNLIQTRRTSLRIRDAQNHSMKNRRNNSKSRQEKSSADVAFDKKHKSSTDSCTGVSLLKASPAMKDSKEAIVPSYCCTNILIVETDRCYRVERAVVISEEMSDSREWHLAVKKDGLTHCTLKAERVMRHCSTNRYTHNKMVSLINGWKLDANHHDWLAFKNLYKDCSGREIPIPAAKLFLSLRFSFSEDTCWICVGCPAFINLRMEEDDCDVVVTDMEPKVFKALLHFIYRDALIEDEEFFMSGSSFLPSISETFAAKLLAAAEKYDLPRLKLMCEYVLCKDISIDSVAYVLALADRHHATELKSICLQFSATFKPYLKPYCLAEVHRQPCRKCSFNFEG